MRKYIFYLVFFISKRTTNTSLCYISIIISLKIVSRVTHFFSQTRCFIIITAHSFNHAFYIDCETFHSWSHKGETKLLWTLDTILGHVTKQFEILGTSGLGPYEQFSGLHFFGFICRHKKTLQILMAYEWDNAVYLQCTQRHSSFRKALNYRTLLPSLFEYIATFWKKIIWIYIMFYAMTYNKSWLENSDRFLSQFFKLNIYFFLNMCFHREINWMTRIYFSNSLIVQKLLSSNIITD